MPMEVVTKLNLFLLLEKEFFWGVCFVWNILLWLHSL